MKAREPRSFVLDLQACQCVSRHRGIGRYSLSFARAVLEAAQDHRVSIFLNGRFPDAAQHIAADLGSLVPPDRILVWTPEGPTAECDAANRGRREATEQARERYLANLRPDLVHVASVFEGFPDDAITSIGAIPESPPAAVTLYDLIPLVYQEHYLQHQGRVHTALTDYYFRKLDYVRRARLVLAISEATRREAIDLLDLPPDRVVTISTAADAMFRPLARASIDVAGLQARLSLESDFVMYTGGPDQRKNIETLVGAWARVPEAVRVGQQLLVVCALSDEHRDRLRALARDRGLSPRDVCLPGYVSDQDLVSLYNLATAFVFPSWHEGFGLPVLEAMACGSAVLASSTSSLPEVVGRSDALFDPHDEADIAARIERVLTDEAFRDDLRRYGPERAKAFSWHATSRRALEAFEACLSGAIA